METQELRYVPASSIEMIDTSTMDRDDWLALRRTGIGGSDVGSIVGVNRYRSAYEVWLDKTGRIPDLDLSDVDAVHFGIVLESAVADRFAYRTGFRIWDPHATFRDRERTWRIANPDRLMVDGTGEIGVLECKTAGMFAADAWADGQIPEAYELQAVHYAGVLGLSYAYLAVLIGGQRLEHRRIDVDPDYVADLDQVTETFWLDHVVTDEPPPVDHTQACTDVLVRLWEAQEGLADLGDDGLDAARRYRGALHDEKAAGEAKALAGNQLRAMLGPHTVGVAGGRKIVTWSETTSRRFDSQAFSADHPELFEQYRRPATQRTLRVPASVET